MGANPITRTLAARPIERIIDSTGSSGCGSPTRIILAVGRQAHQPAEGAQRFGDPLVWLQKSEDADQRSGLVETQPMAVGHCGRPAESTRRAGSPRPAGEPGRAHLIAHEAAVDDHAARALRAAAASWRRLRNRARLRARARARQSSRAAAPPLYSHSRDVGVPIAAADGEIGNQVMQVRFVHHHHARMPQRGFIDEIVMRVVADLIERDIEVRRVESLRARWKRSPDRPAASAIRPGFGIIGDAAARGRQRREEGHAHVQRHAPVRP